jgi:hypothetical protein
MTIDTYEEEHHGKGHRSGQPGQTRPVGKRHVPFAALFIVAFLAVPVLETISWLINLWDAPTGILIGWGWMVCGSGTAVLALGIGFARRRSALVVWHVAMTAFIWGSASMFTTLNGWTKVWGVMHFFGSLMISLSWALYRIDAFRAAATGSGGSDAWSQFIGLARSRPRKIEATNSHMTIEVEHGPGETSQDVISAAKKLESAIGARSGGTVTTPGERADTTKIEFEMADPFADWRTFPGLSHPGLTFAYPFRTAYYATGKDQWFSFVATQGRLSPVVPSFNSEMDTFVGAAGATGSGKSGFLNNAAAEALSRFDGIVCWLDKEKFLQNAGWASDMLGMGGNESNARDFNRALRELGRYRVALFGQVALDAVLDADHAGDDIGRKWTPEVALETGEAAVLVIVDEADTAVQAENWKWLAARGRSLGIFLLPALPRVSTAEVPAVVRGSIATWKTFAVGDNYSQGFTISQATEDAGADPTKFRDPGLHYLDRAPGVDPRMYPVKAREFRSSTKVLRQMVLRAREGFSPAVFSDGAIEAMGDFYWNCHPRAVLGIETASSLKAKHAAGVPLDSQFVPEGAFDAEQTQPMNGVMAALIATASGAIASTPAEMEQAERILNANGLDAEGRPIAAVAPPANDSPDRRSWGEDEDEEGSEDDDMAASATGTSVDDDRVAVVDHRAAGHVDPELERELKAVDPTAPINTRPDGPAVTFDAEDPNRPRWNAEETQAELDRVIAGYAANGKMTFTNSEALNDMRCEVSASMCSRRLTGLADTERIVPPGLQIERTSKTGTWQIVRSQPSPRPRG